MSQAWSQVDRTKWRKVRRLVLQRDGYDCQLRLPGCTVHADEVDHVVPLSTDPDLAYDPSNLRAACRWCNRSRGNARGRRPVRWLV